jgi:hypothetical protein
MSPEEVEELVDFILFGDIHEAPFDLIIDKIGGDNVNQAARLLNDEEYTRTAIAASIRQQYGGNPAG